MLICRKITPCSLVRKSSWWPVVRKWHSCLCIRNLPPTHLSENTPPTHLSENPPPGQWSEAKIRQLRDPITDACTINMSHFFPLLKQSYSHPTTTTCELSMPWMITRKKKKEKLKIDTIHVSKFDRESTNSTLMTSKWHIVDLVLQFNVPRFGARARPNDG